MQRTFEETIFDILEGANYKLRLFSDSGEKVIDPKEATRFYAYEQDLMVSVRTVDDNIEVVVQAGADYDIPGNSNLLKIIRTETHKKLGEFTVRKFNKSIAPKDFAHQSVTESTEPFGKGFGKGFGTVMTSKVKGPNETTIRIRHNSKVNEEKRGARSRNIQSIFIENSQGERFNFPYNNIAGAKAMAMHVSEGNTPYDERGQAILSMCEELANINKFMGHVRGNRLMNENNEDVVLTIREAASKLRGKIKSLSTAKGYNNFAAPEQKTFEKDVDLSEKFDYDLQEAEEMQAAVSTVSKIIAMKEEKDSMEKELMSRLAEVVRTGDFGLSNQCITNEAEYADNLDPVMFSGELGETAKLSHKLSFCAERSKNDETSNLLAELASAVHDMNPANAAMVGKVVEFIEMKSGKTESVKPANTIGLAESAMLGLRKKIA